MIGVTAIHLGINRHSYGTRRIPSTFATFFHRRGGATAAVAAAHSPEVINDTVTEDMALPLSQASQVVSDRDAPLLRDIELLSGILGELVKKESPEAYEYFEEFRRLGLERAADPQVTGGKYLKAMVDLAAKVSAEHALLVMRSFSIMLNLVNSAEVQHRARVTRNFVGSQSSSVAISRKVGKPLPTLEDSMCGTMEYLLQKQKLSPDAVYKQIFNQKVEIVLTAHPTQVQRKSLLRKYRKISEFLALAERPDLNEYERYEAMEALRRIISSIW
jgi:phosphoenolpyruvate carboxylase